LRVCVHARAARRVRIRISSMNEASSAPLVITVSELNRRARGIIEAGFPLLWVAGEISNFTRAPSGHCYFSLKDAQSQVRCVFFRHKAAMLDFQPANGMQVEVRAAPTLYEARGDFQLGVETLRRAGLGLLFEAFERLKKKLAQEGLFDAERKRPIPAFPRAIGLVTSPAAAALRDVLTTLRRRMPAIAVILYPAPVQGEGAAERIAAAIRAASSRAEVDVLVICRGGGSMEDLWAYNEEVVARAICECPVPVVTGVGHETDFTIADFVADLRAPTPTAAAAAVSPDRVELAARLSELAGRLSRGLRRAVERRMQFVDYLGKRLIHPGERIATRLDQLTHLRARLGSVLRHRVDLAMQSLRMLQSRSENARPDLVGLESNRSTLAERLRSAAALHLERRARSVSGLAAHLAHLNPRAVLERGYSIVTTEDGTIVRDAERLQLGQRVSLAFAKGRAGARIERKD
jgi:exodeoxyribonuclease VII large subunit